MSKRRVCIIGWPVEHSRSPLIHNHWIETYGIENAVYERLPVPLDQAEETVSGLRERGFIGANVTVPHKEAAYRALPATDALARRLKAVNTIVSVGSTLEGRNTDGYGFLTNLETSAPGWTAGTGPAVVLGAGGAARAVAAALDDAGAPEIRLVNRTRAKADALVRDLSLPRVGIYHWSGMAAAFDGAGLLVNTTSLGMAGQPPLDIALDTLPRAAVVTDLVYTPLRTRLLEDAAARGNPMVDGLGMLLHQAVPGFEAWFGVRPEVTPALRALVVADLEES